MKKGSLAIITARGGSKRIPKKNIKEFCGKPIIAYSIEAAIQSGLYDEVMVSTDDEEIKRIAIKEGAKVPFMRSESTAGDYASTVDVLVEVIEQYEAIGQEYEDITCIYPTAPFITSDKLQKAHELFRSEQASSLFCVVPFSFPPQRGLFVRNNRIQMADEKSYVCRSQDLETMYHDCGQFYMLEAKHFMKTKQIVTNSTVPFIVDELECQDIDNETDWEIAEVKYQYLQKKERV